MYTYQKERGSKDNQGKFKNFIVINNQVINFLIGLDRSTSHTSRVVVTEATVATVSTVVTEVIVVIAEEAVVIVEAVEAAAAEGRRLLYPLLRWHGIGMAQRNCISQGNQK